MSLSPRTCSDRPANSGISSMASWALPAQGAVGVSSRSGLPTRRENTSPAKVRASSWAVLRSALGTSINRSAKVSSDWRIPS
jgi:hypothetical protein